MRLLRCLFAVLLCGSLAFLPPTLRAADGPAASRPWKIPPLDGQLEGDFRPLSVPGAPSVHWKLTLQTLQPGVRVAGLVVDGPGTHVVMELRLDPAGNGTWRLSEGRIDVATWSAAALAFLGDEFSGGSVDGIVSGEGEGTLREGVFGGRARVSVREGRIDDAAHKLLLHGLDLDLVLEDIAARKSAGGQSLRWDGGTYEEIPFGLGHVEFTLSGEEVSVEEASVEVFGGEVVLAAFSFSTQRREASVIARVIGIEVSQILSFLPPVLASARGRLHGSVALHRSPAGVQIGSGTLALRSGETADLRLAPTPGLLSSSLPASVLKYYPGIGKIETGEVPLRAEHLEVAFTPSGDAQGRTASIHVVGGPVDPGLTAPIDLNINVRGSLESLIKFGTDSRLRFGGGKP